MRQPVIVSSSLVGSTVLNLTSQVFVDCCIFVCSAIMWCVQGWENTFQIMQIAYGYEVLSRSKYHEWFKRYKENW